MFPAKHAKNFVLNVHTWLQRKESFRTYAKYTLLHKELRSKRMYMTPTKGVISHISYRATQGPGGESWKVINTFQDGM